MGEMSGHLVREFLYAPKYYSGGFPVLTVIKIDAPYAVVAEWFSKGREVGGRWTRSVRTRNEVVFARHVDTRTLNAHTFHSSFDLQLAPDQPDAACRRMQRSLSAPLVFRRNAQ